MDKFEEFYDFDWNQFVRECVAEDQDHSLTDEEWDVVLSNEPCAEELAEINSNAEGMIE
jgi:hypothetical protein